MSRKVAWILGLTAGLAVLAAVGGQALTLFEEQKPAGKGLTTAGGLAPGETALGVPIVWPAGFDPQQMLPKGYSPSGRYLACQNTTGDILLLDFSTGQVESFLTQFGSICEPPATVAWGAWLPGDRDRLFVLECWRTAEQRRRSQQEPAFLGGQFAYRIVDLASGDTVYYRPLGNAQEWPFLIVALETGDRWLACAMNAQGTHDLQRVRYFDPVSEEMSDVVYEVDEETERLGYPLAPPWVYKVIKPGPGGQPIVDIEFKNLATQEVRHVSAVRTGGRSVLTSDGAHFISATYDTSSGRWLPVVIETATGRQLAVPDSESWKPFALSEARDAVLVSLVRLVENGYEHDWYEVPLSALLGR